MMRISRLPTRNLPDALSEADKAELRRADMENIISALKGVSAFALSEAVDRIMQNALGHKWMPLPAELRQQCDIVMRSTREADWRAREMRRAYAELANAKRAVTRKLSPDQQMRRRAILARFYPVLAAKEDQKAQPQQ